MRFTEQLCQQAACVNRSSTIRSSLGLVTVHCRSQRSAIICQDYVFLIDYCRVLALAVAKADDPRDHGALCALLHATLHTEMALHRDFAAQFGIRVAELEATAAPSTRSYTQHLLTAAYAGSLSEITAALLPCMWDYSDIGQRLAAQGMPASQPLYSEWIRMYAAPSLESWQPGCAICSSASPAKPPQPYRPA